jgi:hypothetical protein
VLWDAGGAQDAAAERRATPAAQRQIAEFLAPAGRVVDACGGRPCQTLRAGG